MKKSKQIIPLLIPFHFLFFGKGFTTEANAQNIASGKWHTLSLCSDGTVSAWGANLYGQLGTGNNLPSTSPVAVSGLTNVIAIGCGENHSMALKSDSTVWVWGWNEYGQLGTGDQISSNLPVQVIGLSGVTAMDGAVHSIVLRADSTVWTWGYNAWGQIGTGISSNTPTLVPTQVEGLSGIIAVEAAFERSMALRKDSTVWMWGTGFYGALGNGFNLSSFNPIQVPGLTEVVEISTADLNSYALKADGSVWAWGWNEVGAIGDGTYNDAYYPIQVLGLSDIISIDDGSNFAIFLKNDGTAWTVGYNFYGELGIGSNIANSNIVVQVTALSDIVAIEAGTSQCFAIKSDDTVWAWGSNNNNQLGNVDGIEINAPVQVMGICSDIINVEDANESISPVFTIYPNPASDQIFIHPGDDASKNIVTVNIFDYMGKLVWQRTQVSANMPVDVSHLAEGVYTLAVQQDNATTHQSFIKIR
jgi:alpha-tubulin suppressor-like RCC1 family protein